MTPGAMVGALTEIRIKLQKHGEHDSADAISHVQAFLIEFERAEREIITASEKVLARIEELRTWNRELEADNHRLRAELAWAVSK